MLHQKTAVVFFEFVVEAGAGYVGQLHLALARGGGRAAPLADVPHAAARGLHHLVVRARMLVNEPVAEDHRGVIDRLRHLVAAKLLVATMRQERAFGFAHGSSLGVGSDRSD